LFQEHFDFIGNDRNKKRSTRKKEFRFRILRAQDVPKGWKPLQAVKGVHESQAKAILVRLIHQALGRNSHIELKPLR
jgi:hypothetical protein